MIKKLPFETKQTEYEGKILTAETHTNPYDMQVKINELVDAVNEFHKILHDVIKESAENMSWVNTLQDTVLELRAKVKEIDKKPIENPTVSKMENVDPYAEQRKWIGKLCWFWDFKRANAIIGVLTDFETDNPQFRKDGMGWYQCCDPVKPNDDIIYQKD